MKTFTILIISIALLLVACKKDEVNIDPSNTLLGIWNFSEYTGNAIVYTRSTAFIDEMGYEFKNNGTLTERKNSGWCGTPPITYADYSGTWSVINDTLIQVEVGYWGGVSSYKFDIEAVDSQQLRATLVIQVK